jgi:hypothetical protein
METVSAQLFRAAKSGSNGDAKTMRTPITSQMFIIQFGPRSAVGLLV